MTDLVRDAVSALLAVLDVERVSDTSFVGRSERKTGQRVFGGQVLAQSMLAAARTVEPDRLPHSVHGYFLRSGDVDKPITFEVENMRDGRSFSARRTHALQDGLPILAMTTSFQVDQAGLDHQRPGPHDVPGPDDVPDGIGALAAQGHPVAKFWTRTSAFEIRHVERNLYSGPDPEPSDRQLVWMRARSPLPDDDLLHRALLAYACDQVMLEPILRRHGESWETPGLSIASLDHAMWWHRPARVDEWLLYVQDSPSATGGRGLGAARIYTRDGAHVATAAQEGMVRIPGGRPASDLSVDAGG